MDVASLIASLFGLAASVWAALEVRTLRARFRRRAMLPRYIQALDAHASALSEALDPFDGVAASAEVSRLTATLDALARVIERGNSPHLRDVRSRVFQVGSAPQRDDVRALHDQVRKLELTLSYAAAEDEWT